MKKLIVILVLTIITLTFFSCENTEDNTESTTFDRQEMLTNIMDNRIIPAFAQLNTEVDALKSSLDTFADNPSAATLGAAKTAWETAYLTWQSCNAFNFGPAGQSGIRQVLVQEIGTFPVDATQLNTYLMAGDVSFNNFDRDTRGFLAIEYLLFNEGDAAVLARFQGTDASKYKDYLKALGGNLQGFVNTANGSWAGYRDEFISNDGTDVGSSTSEFYNEFVKSYEAAKNFKVGVPAGKRPGQTQAEPDKVEALYSGKSFKFLKAHLESIDAIWQGTTWAGEDGIGFKEYLQSIEGGDELISSTETQYALMIAALDKFSETEKLSEAIVNRTTDVDALQEEMQKQTRFYKSDMSSLLGISITFNSGDGD